MTEALTDIHGPIAGAPSDGMTLAQAHSIAELAAPAPADAAKALRLLCDELHAKDERHAAVMDSFTRLLCEIRTAAGIDCRVALPGMAPTIAHVRSGSRWVLDLLRRVHEETQRLSIELDPHLAREISAALAKVKP